MLRLRYVYVLLGAVPDGPVRFYQSVVHLSFQFIMPTVYYVTLHAYFCPFVHHMYSCIDVQGRSATSVPLTNPALDHYLNVALFLESPESFAMLDTPFW